MTKKKDGFDPSSHAEIYKKVPKKKPVLRPKVHPKVKEGMERMTRHFVSNVEMVLAAVEWSWLRLSKEMDIEPSTIYPIKSAKHEIGTKNIARAAMALKLDPELLIQEPSEFASWYTKNYKHMRNN